MSVTRPLVVALGGNALQREATSGDSDDQWRAARESAARLAQLTFDDTPVVVTHGNGPQVGLALRRAGLAESAGIPPLTMDIAVAHTQGEIGYQLARAIGDALREGRHQRPVAALLTQVIVNEDDPAFLDPDKPIGAWMPEVQALRLARTRNWTVRHLPPRGWRRVVPSPRPTQIVELPVIRVLLAAGALVVCCGGGGVPLIATDGGYRGVPAVIDKDATSALLATTLDAECLVIVTDVPTVSLDHGTPAARPLTRMDVGTAAKHLTDGQFPAGSMGPKVRAAMNFVLATGRPARITNLEQISDPSAGTLIVPQQAG